MGGIVLFSDPHFANRTAFGRIESNAEFPGCNSRFHVIADSFRKAVDYAEDNYCEAIFILGDIFHDRGQIDIPVYNGVYQLLRESTERDIKVVMYPGNHDYVDLRAMYAHKHLHSLFMYEKLVNVCDSPSIVQTAHFSVAVVPFSKDADQVIAYSDRLVNKMSGDIKVLMLHHSIDGAVTGPHEWQMPSKLQATKLNKAYTHKFSGHYHMHQKVEGGLWYVGAPVQHDLGERNYIPGFIHMSPDGTWKHIENKVAPRFVQLETNSLEEVSKLNDCKNYKHIKWTGDPSILDPKHNNIPENCIVEVHPSSSSTEYRTTIRTTDTVDNMLKKYVEAKAPEDTDEIYKHGVSLYQGSK